MLALSASAAVPAPASGSGGGMTWMLAPMGAATVVSADGAVALTQSSLNAVDMAVAGIESAAAPSDLSVSRLGNDIVVRTSASARWSVYSILGTMVAEGTVAEGRSVVALDGMAPAMYIFSIADTRGASQTIKIVVE